MASVKLSCVLQSHDSYVRTAVSDNDFVRFYLTFSEDEHANKTVSFHVLLHETSEELEV